MGVALIVRSVKPWIIDQRKMSMHYDGVACREAVVIREDVQQRRSSGSDNIRQQVSRRNVMTAVLKASDWLNSQLISIVQLHEALCMKCIINELCSINTGSLHA